MDSSQRFYLKWVCEQACCVSHRQGAGIQPHHIKGYDQHLGKKVCDLFAIPLFHELHAELHNNGWRAFENKYAINQQKEVLKLIERAFYEQVLTINRLAV